MCAHRRRRQVPREATSFAPGRTTDDQARRDQTTESLIWLEELRREDVAKVGGKNSSLGEMISTLGAKGIKVPGGFATTSDAYRAFVEANGLRAVIREKMEALDEHRITLQEAGSSIRKAFEAGHWPEDIAEDIKTAYAEMSARAGQDRAVRRRALVGHRRGPARCQFRRSAGDLPERRRTQGAAGIVPPLLRLALHRPGDHLSQPQRLRPRGGGAVDRGAADGALRPVVLGRDVLHRHRNGF
jgi:hypothetical protein